MYPVLVQLGPLTIYSLWVGIAIGFFQAFLFLHKLIQKDREKIAFLAHYSLAIFLAGLIGARLLHILKNLTSYFETFDFDHIIKVFFIWDQGLSFWGGIAGIVLALWYFSKKEHQNILEWLDILMISALGGLFFGNIGLFLDGRNYGNETNLPWGVIIDSSRFAVPIHPTQLYAAVYCLLIALMLFQLRTTKFFRKEGNITLLGLTLFTFFKFLEEFLRGDEANYAFGDCSNFCISFLGLRETQVYCILIFLFSIIMLYIRHRKKSITSVS